MSRQPKETLQDPEIIRRAAEWYARCLDRIERERRKSGRSEADARKEAV